MQEYVSKLHFSFYCSANIGLVILSKSLVYIMTMRFRLEFKFWPTAVQNFFSACSESFVFHTLTSQLLNEDIYQSIKEATSVALLNQACIAKNASKSIESTKTNCKNYTYNYPYDNFYHKCPKNASSR